MPRLDALDAVGINAMTDIFSKARGVFPPKSVDPTQQSTNLASDGVPNGCGKYLDCKV